MIFQEYKYSFTLTVTVFWNILFIYMFMLRIIMYVLSKTALINDPLIHISTKHNSFSIYYVFELWVGTVGKDGRTKFMLYDMKLGLWVGRVDQFNTSD